MAEPEQGGQLGGPEPEPEPEPENSMPEQPHTPGKAAVEPEPEAVTEGGETMMRTTYQGQKVLHGNCGDCGDLPVCSKNYQCECDDDLLLWQAHQASALTHIEDLRLRSQVALR